MDLGRVGRGQFAGGRSGNGRRGSGSCGKEGHFGGHEGIKEQGNDG